MSSEPLDYINKKEDLSRIAVKSDLTDWSLACDVQLPEDASKILGLQPLVVPFGDDSMSGLAMLYILQSKLQLDYRAEIDEFLKLFTLCRRPGTDIHVNGRHFSSLTRMP